MSHELITMGRISVDVYPQDIGVGLEDVETFGKYLGGSPTNVAVAAARYGRRAAVITRTGDDPFGEFLRSELRRYNVAEQWASPVRGLPTPVTFCAIRPPEDFPLYFYGRSPTAPDWEIRQDEVDVAAVAEAGIFWTTVTGLARPTSRQAQVAAHQARPREALAEGQHTVLDLDYRPMFWESAQQAREQIERILPQITVAVGNREECAVAVGDGSADEQADRLLEAGVRLAVVKLGSEGVMAATPERRVISAPVPMETVNGLGAGDSFGGALCHGLLSGWDLEQVLDFANAAGAHVASRIACSEAMPASQEVQALLRAHGRRVPQEVAS
ncbi:5-dehydro-2-deoxygluconokinase [Nesterenkonia aerolata]|uniref:5-dehydro-2-deoxygluconokinase n=1 Tax=Nesterenkonia aerolata TaxID=3074079 RepID=A0ABU2DU27_9MICC|nr:5-dehydro-2-deoxygluconokinase [Nesterenkonia sp. LY-0111]MDR8019994.1 5-dehydro-2-deoxygluconokinase [Nesterenkonia sp. LY-0111]